MLSFNVMRYAGRRVWLLMISGGAILLSACTILPSAPVSQVYLLPAVDELRRTLATLRAAVSRLEENPAALLRGRERTQEFTP